MPNEIARMMCMTLCLTSVSGFVSLSPAVLRTPLSPQHLQPHFVEPRLATRSLARPFGPRMSAAVQPSPAASTEGVVVDKDPPARPVIVGSGPTGLACAVMLARRGWTNIQVYDRLPPPPPKDSDEWGNPERSYNVGINGRGQTSLAKLGVWEDVDAVCADVTGRREWVPGKDGSTDINTSRKRGFNTKIVPRDLLQSTLVEHIEGSAELSGRINIHFSTMCTRVELSNDMSKPTLLTFQKTRLNTPSPADTSASKRATATQERPRSTVTVVGDKEVVFADFVVGADGFRSQIRDAMVEDESPLREKGLKVRVYPDDNVRVYKTIPLDIKEDTDLNYSARGDSDINFDALPSKQGGYLGVVIFRPDDKRVTGVQTGADALRLFEEHLPAIVPLLSPSSCDKFASKPVSRFPTFLSTGPALHRGSNMVLLGDCIHTVKPFFGLGVNSAFEDIVVLDKSL
eukprot:CAMPEP_0114150032 /NCGR_PEP_ID=MMETSP0043_2-20121206/22483_1 /TAXON_ID=464988 /ORGANISM="Hemiselmis andersenii, Strain CCMP644" /LENGTH=457 /DNA_ID=CAMNT_0001244729 /DNA_START=28 /DNA_END=1398 /DNA_ORIENTATION=-